MIEPVATSKALRNMSRTECSIREEPLKTWKPRSPE